MGPGDDERELMEWKEEGVRGRRGEAWGVRGEWRVEEGKARISKGKRRAWTCGPQLPDIAPMATRLT